MVVITDIRDRMAKVLSYVKTVREQSWLNSACTHRHNVAAYRNGLGSSGGQMRSEKLVRWRMRGTKLGVVRVRRRLRSLRQL